MPSNPPLLLVVTLAEAGDSATWIEEYVGGAKLRSIAVRERAVEDDVRDAVLACPSGTCAVVAVDQRFMGFLVKRASDVLEQYGVVMPALVHPTAFVASNVSLGAGVRIGARAVVGQGTVLQAHARVLECAVIGRACQIGAFTTIEPAAILGHGAQVGQHSWIKSGVVLAAGARVENVCELQFPGLYEGVIPEGTLQHAGLDSAARIHRFG